MKTPVSATHPNYSGQRWAGTSTSMCYGSSLNNLFIDGSTGQLGTITTVLNNARTSWNNLPSVWTLNFNSNSNCANQNGATSYPLLYNAQTFTVKLSTAPNTIIEVDTLYNTNHPWSVFQCVTPNKNLPIVAKHEFGHWVRFLEDPQSPTHSVMYDIHDCLAGTITTADSNELTSIYG